MVDPIPAYIHYLSLLNCIVLYAIIFEEYKLTLR